MSSEKYQNTLVQNSPRRHKLDKFPHLAHDADDLHPNKLTLKSQMMIGSDHLGGFELL